MKRLALLSVVLLSTLAFGDQITVEFAFGGPNSVDASLSGVSLGPAVNLAVSDQEKLQSFSLSGFSSSFTGSATSFAVLTTPNIVLANFHGAGPGSVLVTDGMGNILIAGSMDTHGALVSTYPSGTGAFLGDFKVSFVSPTILALFGLGPHFLPDGSVSATFGDSNLVGVDHLVGSAGGGSVTIQTPVPEPSTLGLAGCGILAGMLALRRKLLV